MEVELLAEAIAELDRLPVYERVAMMNAIEKLRVVGINLGAPHTSQIKGTDLREIRPRQGRSPWRGIYRRSGDVLVVAAIGPEAEHDRKGFDRAVGLAAIRIRAFQTRPAQGDG